MENNLCYLSCNKKFKAWDSKRIYCKKGCDSDEDTLNLCKNETCNSLCLKLELGDEKADNKLISKISTFFSRAPVSPNECLLACNFGCNNKVEEED